MFSNHLFFEPTAHAQASQAPSDLLIDDDQGATSTTSLNHPQGTIESHIDGEFLGWDGETIFKLTNGQIWRQSAFAFAFSFKTCPKIWVIPNPGGYAIHVDGMDKFVQVVRTR